MWRVCALAKSARREKQTNGSVDEEPSQQWQLNDDDDTAVDADQTARSLHRPLHGKLQSLYTYHPTFSWSSAVECVGRKRPHLRHPLIT